jgi:hypothetical protein
MGIHTNRYAYSISRCVAHLKKDTIACKVNGTFCSDHAQIPEFHYSPPGFVRQLCVFLVPMHVMDHEMIIQKNDVSEFLYIIIKGTVMVTIENGDELFIGEGG